MKKRQAILTGMMMMGLVTFGANMAFADSAATGADKKTEVNKSDSMKNDHGSSANCQPSGSSSIQKNDQAVGNDSPLTSNSQSKKDETAATAPCPQGQDQSAQPGGSINQDKGGASGSQAIPDNNAGPDNHVK
jgi:hypothetical protein